MATGGLSFPVVLVAGGLAVAAGLLLRRRGRFDPAAHPGVRFTGTATLETRGDVAPELAGALGDARGHWYTSGVVPGDGVVVVDDDGISWSPLRMAARAGVRPWRLDRTDVRGVEVHGEKGGGWLTVTPKSGAPVDLYVRDLAGATAGFAGYVPAG